MKSLVVLVNPPRLNRFTKRPGGSSELSLGLASIMAVLRDQGYIVRFIDAEAYQYSAAMTAQLCLEDNPLFVGFTAPTYLIKSAAAVAALIKQRASSTPLVIGGYHASALPEETLQGFPQFDIAVFGEGEATALELARALQLGSDLAGIAGLAYRDGVACKRNPPRAWLENLDQLPFPAWEFFPLELYKAHYTSNRKIRELSVTAARGCLGRCITCARMSGETIRTRSPELVITEIERDLHEFGANAIIFTDATFAADRPQAESICDLLLHKGLHKKFYWLCQTRVDAMSPALVSLMAKAGCRYLGLGLDSGDPKILKSMKKEVDLDRAVIICKAAQEAGIMVDTFSILGLPGDTWQSINRTIEFTMRLNPDFANFFICTPLPGSEVYHMAQQGLNGLQLLTDDWDFYGIQIGKAMAHKALSRSRLERAQFLAYLRFYLRPAKFRNLFKMVDLKILPVYLFNLLEYKISRITKKFRTHDATQSEP